MHLSELVERIAHWASQPPGDTRLAAARSGFEARTAPIEIDQADYEARIAHFLDGYICDGAGTEGPPPVAAFAEHHPGLDTQDRAALAGLLRSQRSLYRVRRVEPTLTVLDLIRGAQFELCADRRSSLAVDDLFDGRVAATAQGLTLTPGRVFHPASTHAPLLSLLEQVRERELDPDGLADALLGMRDRLYRFTRVKPEHLYRLEALGNEASSAPSSAE